MTYSLPRPARLRPAELLRLGLIGPRTRRLRSALSALGVALGIAAVVAITGISASNQAHLLDRFDRLGSNLVTVSPGKNPSGAKVPLPDTATKMLGNIPPVEQISTTADTKANIYRNDAVPLSQTNSLHVLSAQDDLLKTIRGELSSGRWLDRATERLPVVVLGHGAAERLGVEAPGETVWLEGKGLAGAWYGVIGTLQPNELVPDIDDTALVGTPQAIAALGGERTPSTVYLRIHPERVNDVQGVAAATANPAKPSMVAVSRPSDLLKARAETNTALSGLLLSLAGVALLVGGVGIANTMVVSVMERRGEVGLRRALGARRGQITMQFLIEAVLLGLFGGLAGAAAGVTVVYTYAAIQGWPAVVPMVWVLAGPAVAVGVGAAAGLYPALRAAQMSPTGALRSS
ncbi:ABC transporter permease [Streptomyces sp. NPDC097617]|uniref:ABC transporter permease n=1 Tax=Streptomyces sp. NPDC097617 TaxID=3366091 RepID=UPI003803C7AB